MIGHLGSRVSALLDGQLSPAEAEEAWAHVYACPACRDLVEREGWIKTRLAGLGHATEAAPSDHLKGSLLQCLPPEDRASCDRRDHARRTAGLAVLGGGAIGAAMLGVVALGVVPGGTTTGERRPAADRIQTSQPADAPSVETVPAVAPAWVRSLVH